jgi:hypothetical protein
VPGASPVMWALLLGYSLGLMGVLFLVVSLAIIVPWLRVLGY